MARRLTRTCEIRQHANSLNGPQRGPVMQPKGAEPLASAPLGIAQPPPTKSPDRNAVPSWVQHQASGICMAEVHKSQHGLTSQHRTRIKNRSMTMLKSNARMDRNAVPPCSPRVPSRRRVLPWESQPHHPPSPRTATRSRHARCTPQAPRLTEPR
jgi:hypothetical protein